MWLLPAERVEADVRATHEGYAQGFNAVVFHSDTLANASSVRIRLEYANLSGLQGILVEQQSCSDSRYLCKGGIACVSDSVSLVGRLSKTTTAFDFGTQG